MGRTRLNLISCLVVAAAITALASPGSAFAAATIGTNMGNVADSNANGCNDACTVVNRIVLADSAPQGVTAPVNGTVTSWRFSDAAAGNTISLRILRQVDNQSFAGISTSAAQTSVIGLNGPFPTSLPIKAGDFIGLNAGSGGGSFLYGAMPVSFLDMYWNTPPLGDGETRNGVGSNQEVMVQATVDPSNKVTFDPPVRNKKNGTAAVTMHVPNPGSLTYSGTNVKVVGPPSTATSGDVMLAVKATGKKRKRLNEKGKVGVTFSITFTPTFGTAHTESDSFKLRKKHKR